MGQEIIESLQHRNPNSTRPFANMLIHAELNKVDLPDWAYRSYHLFSNEYWWTDYTDINVVNMSSYEYVKSNGLWPLRVNYSSGDRNSGYKIVGKNISNFFDKQEDNDEDTIQLRILNFATDPGGGGSDTKGIPTYFDLLYFFEFHFYRKLIDFSFIFVTSFF